MSIEIKEVIQIAREQFKELAPELSIDASDLRLEEIEREGDNWALTFSVPNPRFGIAHSSAAGVMGGRPPFYGSRIAKIIVVDGSKGQFLALRERAA
jgi:hypothetical protein